MLFEIVVLVCLFHADDAAVYPGDEEFEHEINRTIVMPLRTGDRTLEHKVHGTNHEIVTVSVWSICDTLTSAQNKDKVADMTKTNSEYLDVPADADGAWINAYDCRRATRMPNTPQLNTYAGVHVGKIYTRDNHTYEDTHNWNRVGSYTNWYQHIEDKTVCERGCNCRRRDPVTGVTCAWSFNYVGDDGDREIVYKWDPMVDNANALTDSGLKAGYGWKVTSPIFKSSFLNKFYSKLSPMRETNVCYDKFGQYEIEKVLHK